MKDLEPSVVWGYFEEILQIPRLSKHEEKIIAYVEQFARKHQLSFKKDDAGNCLIFKPATSGYEDRETVILQSHLDMVGEKRMGVEHDFSKDPIQVQINGDWLMARDTTLGADDGIGVAATLAILASETIEHGPLECLFTVDEESGMTGALGLGADFMKGSILLNLDSEDEGEIFIGCAGGIDTIGLFKKKIRSVPEGRVARKIIIEGLQGGHSGDEIHKGFGNSIKLMNRMLWNLDRKFGIHLASFEGGKLRNAIPREASAVILLKEEKVRQAELFFDELYGKIMDEIAVTEPGFRMTMTEEIIPDTCYKKSFHRRLLNTLYACPHGVITWSPDIDGLVETSSNLAILRDKQDDHLELVTSQRSSRESAKRDIADRIYALLNLAGAEVSHSDGYPGWKPDRNSEILRISEKVYRELFNQDPQIKAIHAGLECGLFLVKYPSLDMISFGPTIKGAHTPEERLHIGSVSRFWNFLLELLKQAPLAEKD